MQTEILEVAVDHEGVAETLRRVQSSLAFGDEIVSAILDERHREGRVLVLVIRTR